MSAIQHYLRTIAFVTVLLGGAGLLMAMFLGVADVVGTYLGHPVPGVFEVTQSAIVLIVFGGLTYAQIRSSHIRVEIFYLRAGPKWRSTMDVVTLSSAILFFALLAWQGYREAQYSWEIGEVTSGLIEFPLFPARVTLAFGALLFVCQLLLELTSAVLTFGNELEQAAYPSELVQASSINQLKEQADA